MIAMKQKPLNKNIILVISLICAIIFGALAITNFNAFTKNPFERNTAFDSPVFSASDLNSNSYVIDSSMMRIIKIKDNSAIYTIEGGLKEQGFYCAQEITTDSRGNLYVLDYVLDDKGQYVEKERILKYSDNGSYMGEVFSYIYKEDERPLRTGNICSITIYDSSLYFYMKQIDTIQMHSVNINSREETLIRSIDFKDAGNLVIDFATSKDAQKSYFTTKRGEIYSSDSNGQVTNIYLEDDSDSKTPNSIPWEIEIDDRGTVYYTDLLGREIKTIENDKVSSSILSSEFIKSKGFDNQNGIYYRLSVKGNEVYTVCNENVIGYSDQNIVFFASESALPLSVYLFNMLNWVYLLIFVASIFYICRFVYISIFKKKISTVLMQSAFVTVVIAIVTIIVSSMMLSSFESRYETEVFNRIEHTMYLTSRNIDGDTLEKINKPIHFMDENYKKVREQLHSSFNDNKDVWNEGFYGALYTVVDDKPYAIMYYDDSKCPFYPLYEDGSEVDYLNSFNENKTITTKSSDVEGDWMYGITPVFNSKGETVGVLEVGTDLFGFQAENNKLRNNVLLETATLLVVLVFVMIEITILSNIIQRRRELPKVLVKDGKITKNDTLLIRPLCFLIYAACFVSMSFTPILMKQLYEPMFGLSESIILALPISAEALFLAVFSVIGGYVLDKVGWKYTFVTGMCILFAGQLASGLADSAMFFILARALAGCGMGLTFISMQNYVVLPESEEDRNEGIAALNSGGYAGLNSGLIVGGMLAGTIGFSKVYFVSAIIVLICVLIAIKATKNAIAHGSENREKGSSVKLIFKFFKSYKICMFFLMVLLPVIICTMFIDYYFPLFAESQNMSTSSIGRAFLLNGLSIIYLGPLLSKYIPKYIGSKLSMLLAGAIVCTGIIQFAIIGTITSALVAIFLIGVGESFGITTRINYYSSTNEVAKLGQGKALGYYGLIENLGQVLGPIIYGIAVSVGVAKGISFMGMLAIALIGLFLVTTLRRKK